MRVLISAQIDMAPEKRERALAEARPFIEAALAEPGCLHYDWSLDSQRPTRINVFEEWESEEALAGHFDNSCYWAMRDHVNAVGITSAVSHKYRCDAKETVYDEAGTPRPYFA